MLAVWISGWGIPPESLRSLAGACSPGARLELLAPTAEAAEAARQADLVVAWSFGAFRVLEAVALGKRFAGDVFLLAPFISFAADHGWGGRCTLTQLKWLKRWLARDPAGALRDFYQRAGISFPVLTDAALVAQWGGDLDTLMEDAGPALSAHFCAGLPARFHAVIGEQDSLLEARRIAAVLPGTRIVPGAGHECGPLLAALRGAHAL